MNILDIDQVIEKVKMGNTELFEVVIEIYQQQIFRYCFYMLNNTQDAEDCVQDVFLKAFQKLHLYKHNHSFPAWLYRIAANHCINVIKQKKRFHALLPLLGRSEAQDDSNHTVNQTELSDEISYAISRLKFEERNLLILRVFQEKSFEEIAEIQNVNATMLRKKFERLKRKLQKLFLSGGSPNERFIVTRSQS